MNRKIERRIEISAPIEKVWGLLSDTELYPKLVPEVKSLNVLERNPDGTEMKVELISSVPVLGSVNIIQNVKYHPLDYKMEFTQLKGHFTKFKGIRHLYLQDGEVIFYSCIEYYLEKSFFNSILRNSLEPILIKNLENFQKNTKNWAET